jgi:phosphate transport system permease protein
MTKVILRQLMPGIVTAVLLAVGRGIGDAATVLFTAGYTDNIPHALNQPAATLPLAIFFQLGSPVAEVQNRAYGSAVILTVIILILSLFGISSVLKIKFRYERLYLEPMQEIIKDGFIQDNLFILCFRRNQ